MRNVVPVDAFTDPVTVVENGDVGDEDSFQPTAQALTNRTLHLKTLISALGTILGPINNGGSLVTLTNATPQNLCTTPKLSLTVGTWLIAGAAAIAATSATAFSTWFATSRVSSTIPGVGTIGVPVNDEFTALHFRNGVSGTQQESLTIPPYPVVVSSPFDLYAVVQCSAGGTLVAEGSLWAIKIAE